MKVPFSILKEYLDIHHSAEEIAKALTLAGIEVEGIEKIGSDFSGVVTAKVISTEPHPNADRLKVAKVFDGMEELQIVCGAKNCREGMITALAKIGAILPPDETGKPLKIKKGKLRDVDSYGMLCGADELGLAKEGDGIMELPTQTELGVELTNLFSDVIFDISLTPNLGHCLGIYGLARELSALLDIAIKPLHFAVKESGQSIHSQLSAHIEANDLCPRYMARLAQNIQVGPSPDWLKRKVEAAGIRSVNNVVDISSYVMQITGQPLHMFDYDTIAGHRIEIKKQHVAQKTTTLDGIEREIPSGSLMIYDSTSPIAIAGIMGGQESSVTEKTKNIVIESAVFSPQTIRHTSKELSLKTDASYRFERAVDPLGVAKALDMAASLLQEICKATVCEGVVDINPSPFIAKKIQCRTDRVQNILGIDISQREIVGIFERLSMRIAKEEENIVSVIVPSFRNDISTEIDLIEEVARIYGYNRLPRRQPLHVSSTMENAPIFTFENKVRDCLMGEGLQEMITCDLISPATAELTKEPSQKDIHHLSVMQSKSSDFSVLRASLLAGLLTSIKHNISHQIDNVSCFEIGRIHYKQKESIEEISCVAIALTGQIGEHHHSPKPKEVDFFDLKGIAENLMQSLKIAPIHFEISHLHNFQPGRQAKIMHKDVALGVIGQLHPARAKAFDIEQKVYYAELNLHELMHHSCELTKVKALPVFPGSERDWTLTVKRELSVAEILNATLAVKMPILENVFLLDLFESDKLGSDRKNVTLRFSYRDTEKTLSYETVESAHAELTKKVIATLSDAIIL